MILTETLFTLLLVTFVLLATMLVTTPRGWMPSRCGLVLGLGALTRSVLWPVPLLLCPLLIVLLRGSFRKRLLLSGLVLGGYLVVVTPWAVRNTRLQGVVTIVDTMGGMNLRMGNYEHTPEDRMWDAVSLTGDRNWIHGFTGEFPGQVVTEGHKDKWAQRMAIEYMLSHPGTTFRRALIKFADFWGLERELVAGVQQGLYDPPRWIVVLGRRGDSRVATSRSASPAAPPSGSLRPSGGCTCSCSCRSSSSPVCTRLCSVTRATTFLSSRFSRYMPHDSGRLVRSRAWRDARMAKLGAVATVLVLLAAWIRQVLVVDAGRVRAFLEGVF